MMTYHMKPILLTKKVIFNQLLTFSCLWSLSVCTLYHSRLLAYKVQNVVDIADLFQCKLNEKQFPIIIRNC